MCDREFALFALVRQTGRWYFGRQYFFCEAECNAVILQNSKIAESNFSNLTFDVFWF